MDPLDLLLSSRAAQPATGDGLDALLQAQGNPGAAPQAPVPMGPPKPVGPPQPLTFAEKYIAPALSAVFGDNIQGSPTGRFVQGMADLPIGAEQLVANAVGAGPQWNQRIHDLEQQYQQERSAAGSNGVDWMRAGGNLAATALLPAAAPEASLLGRVGQGVATGAAYNAAMPVTNAQPANLSSLVTGQAPQNYWDAKGQQVNMGAGFGAGGALAGDVVGRVLSPNVSPQAQALMDQGVTLTPGRVLGGGWQRVEDSLTSVPILGDFIRDAQGRMFGDFNRAAYARALAPVGKEDVAATLPAGPEGVAGVKQALKDAYNTTLPNLQWKQDAPFDATVNNITNMVRSGLPDRESSAYTQILTDNLDRATATGRMDGQTYKEVEANLGQEARSFSKSSDTYQQKLGAALRSTQQAFRDALARSNPNDAQTLADINQGYANYARIRSAAASAGDKSNGFTPAQLAAAVRGADSTAGKDATATGAALMQDLSDAGRAVLPSTVPDSGTPLRHAVQWALPALAGHAMLPESMGHAMAPMAAVGGLMTLPYTTYGQKLAQVLLAQRPDGAAAAAQLVRQGAPLVGAAAAPALLPASQ